jgi:hypothetical protein
VNQAMCKVQLMGHAEDDWNISPAFTNGGHWCSVRSRSGAKSQDIWEERHVAAHRQVLSGNFAVVGMREHSRNQTGSWGQKNERTRSMSVE